SDVITGVRWMCGEINSLAARMSESVGADVMRKSEEDGIRRKEQAFRVSSNSTSSRRASVKLRGGRSPPFFLLPCTLFLAMYVGRLAPSPTGFLHLGHAATFRVAQQRARDAHGKLLLRIEDLDRPRCKPEFEQSLIDDLKWAGLSWDGEPARQTER